MALTAIERRDLWAAFMEDISRRVEPIGITKTELRAAIDAIDDWVEANAAAFNAAIPQPARGALTAAQKAALLSAIARKRAGGR